MTTAANPWLPQTAVIEEIRADGYAVAVFMMGNDASRWAPTTRETADHSLPYCVAVALIDGELNALILWDVDPLRDLPDPEGWREALGVRLRGIIRRFETTNRLVIAVVAMQLGSGKILNGPVLQSHALQGDEIAAIPLATENARGALADLCRIIAENEGDIINLKLLRRTTDFFDMQFDIEVADARHLTNLIAGMRTSKAVKDVERVRG